MKILGFEITRNAPADKGLDKKKVVSELPQEGGRVSSPDYATGFENLKNITNTVTPEFSFEVIPLIRKLVKVNPDMGQALNDLIQLANTGIKIQFDPGVEPDMQDKMRKHVETKAMVWGSGVAGLPGLINKMLSQLMISGASSVEWVVSQELDGLINIVFINPENIRAQYNPRTTKHDFFQATTGLIKPKENQQTGLIALNPLTYIYVGLNGDVDSPYGTPPYLTALESISTQRDMVDNMKFIVKMLGIMGYLDVSMAKPEQLDGESELDYKKRLEGILSNLKSRVQQGFRDGINVGYTEDHEFNFHPTSKTAAGVAELFNLNEILVASGLKFDSAFLGRNYGSTETLITILFTKMLSQLSNLQNLIAFILKKGITLELLLAGYKFDYLDIEFNKSTITDELKYQQSQEYKIRNTRTLYADGIISQETYADLLGFKKPDLPEPRVPIDPNKIQEDSVDKKKRADQKDTSKRTTTDKKKPQGTLT